MNRWATTWSSTATLPEAGEAAAGPGRTAAAWEAVAVGGLATAAAVGAAAARAKLVAVTLGPVGLGWYAQLAALAALLTLLGTFCLGGGLPRELALAIAGPDRRAAGTILRSALGVLLIPTAALGALGFLFAPAVAGLVFADPGRAAWVRWLLPCLPVAGLGGVAVGALRAAREVRRLAVAQAAAVVIGVGVVYLLLTTGGLPALAWAPLSLAALQALFAAAAAWPLVAPMLATPGPWWDGRAARVVARYGGASLLLALLVAATSLGVGRVMLASGGAGEAGCFRALWSLSESLVLVATAGFHSYFYPTFCRARGAAEGSALLTRFMEVSVLGTLALLAPVTLLAPWLVPLLFSGGFGAAVPLVGLHLAGDFVRINGWIAGLPLLARGQLRALVGLNVGWSMLFWGLLGWWFPQLGLKGYALAYAASWPALFAAQLWLVRRGFGIRLALRSAALFLGGLALLALLAWLTARPA